MSIGYPYVALNAAIMAELLLIRLAISFISSLPNCVLSCKAGQARIAVSSGGSAAGR